MRIALIVLARKVNLYRMIDPSDLPLDLEEGIQYLETHGKEIVGPSVRIHDPIEVAKIFQPRAEFGTPEFRKWLMEQVVETGAIHQVTFTD